MIATLDIEAFATWAFVEELPKQAFAALSPTPSASARDLAFGQIGPIDDDSAREPGFPALAGPPHADALAFRDVWQRLDTAPDSWVPDLEELLSDRPHCVPAARYGREMDPDDDRSKGSRGSWQALRTDARTAWCPSAIVRSMAIRRARPEWHPEAPTWDYVRRAGRPKWFVIVERRGPRGKQVRVEVEGLDRRGRPKPGAYRKALWSPDPFLVAKDRAEYVIWWRALRHIAGELRDLRVHRITGPAAEKMPWRGMRHPGQEAPMREGQVLRDVRPAMSAARAKRGVF